MKANTLILITLALASSLPAQEKQPEESCQTKSLIDFFLPLEPQGELVSAGIWGAENVLPRDINNGLEDSTLENWCYWDGSIVKSDDGRYHMYGSCWPQTFSHSKGWHYESMGMHAVADKPLGPYKHLGLTWPDWNNGKGHNVVALRIHDGRYAVITSEITAGEIFVSDSPDGPFELMGEIKIDPNGFDPVLARYDQDNAGAVKSGTVGHMANVQILVRPDDGRYMLVPRSTAIMISDNGILGPYKIMSDKIYRDMEGVPQEKMEDPTVWYSGGMYHMVVNYHGEDTSHHFTSVDGIHNWKHRGIAFRKDGGIFRYTDGTVNQWAMVQRMTVYVEDGHPTHFLFSVIDVHKGKDGPDDNHGSKIVVVPFDGEAFDREMKALVAKEK